MNDDYLKVWQIKQIEKSRIQNALNELIEAHSTINHEEFPPLGLLELYDPADKLEESAILMAIHAHGLQQNNERISMYSVNDDDSSNSSLQLRSCSPSIIPVVGNPSRNVVNSTNNAHTFINNNNNNNNDGNVNIEISNLMEAAISVAIQKQGLGLLEPNR